MKVKNTCNQFKSLEKLGALDVSKSGGKYMQQITLEVVRPDPKRKKTCT
jgi:hypothetical protein